jgi:hypothetical protein
MLAAILGHEIAHAHAPFPSQSEKSRCNHWVIDNLSRLNPETTAKWTKDQEDRIGEMARALYVSKNSRPTNWDPFMQRWLATV